MQRHKLTLTEAGERFLLAMGDHLELLQAAIAGAATDRGEPAGVLKVSMGLTFGADYILTLLPAFLARYPSIRPDWRFESRQVDLIAEGYDAAIGGGIELAAGLVTRSLAPLHIIARRALKQSDAEIPLHANLESFVRSAESQQFLGSGTQAFAHAGSG
jgi:DNA-binding transcriptional LysR family regulator